MVLSAASGHSLTQAVLRSLLFACIVLALARPVLLTEAQAMFQVLVVDHSASISPQQREKANALTEVWLGQVKDRDKSSIVVIGGDRKPLMTRKHPAALVPSFLLHRLHLPVPRLL